MLEAQRKPSVVGISGAGKGKKSRGTGFIYDRKDQKSKEQLANEQRMAAMMSTPEWQARNALQCERERKRAERLEARRGRLAEKKWNYMRSHLAKQRKDVERELELMYLTANLAVAIALARRTLAQTLRRERAQKDRTAWASVAAGYWEGDRAEALETIVQKISAEGVLKSPGETMLDCVTNASTEYEYEYPDGDEAARKRAGITVGMSVELAGMLWEVGGTQKPAWLRSEVGMTGIDHRVLRTLREMLGFRPKDETGEHILEAIRRVLALARESADRDEAA